jgi:cytoplasmic iron level regulating protein YaaA (DUF328/UPF0246 family)
MLILLPPSETKRPGGVGISIDKAAIIWAALDPTRDKLIRSLSQLCLDQAAAVEALGLGAKSAQDTELNLNLMTSPTMPALQRYSGVLYQALDYSSLSAAALKRANERLFIQSALFGLLPAMEQIPNYRFSAAAKLPGINLRSVWQQAHEAVWPRIIGDILDLRSKDYQDLNPIPNNRQHFTVEVMSEDGKALNHFNKKTKGLFARASLEHGLESISEVTKVAKLAGLRASVQGQTVTLFAPAN